MGTCADPIQQLDLGYSPDEGDRSDLFENWVSEEVWRAARIGALAIQKYRYSELAAGTAEARNCEAGWGSEREADRLFRSEPSSGFHSTNEANSGSILL